MSYKIVRPYTTITGEKSFVSLTRGLSNGGVVYRVRKPTYPYLDCGPLAVFKTLRDVREFQRLHGWDAAIIFKCKVKKETKKTCLFAVSSRAGDYTTRYFTDTLPTGTILCKEVTLTKLIL